MLRDILYESKSDDRFFETSIEVKNWQRNVPTVDAVRPARCPGCGHAGAPAGDRLGLIGHGVRERQVWGPAELDGAPVMGTVMLRRYQCRGCGAIVMVGPRGLLFRRLYTASAIAGALTLWACRRQPAPAVRRRISPLRIVGATAASGWVSLLRWARKAVSGGLWRGLACATEPTLRRCTARVVALVAATVPTGEALEARVFAGAHLVR